MRKSKKAIVIIILIIIMTTICNVIYSKYIIRKSFSVSVSSAAFYFDAEKIDDTIIFDRTADPADTDKILTDLTTFGITVKNNNGTNYNKFPVEYEITIVDNDKFTFEEGDKITKTIDGGSKKDDTISLNLKIKNLEIPKKKITIRITSTSPYAKTIELTFNVQQLGAIQTIEDLVDLSKNVRGETTKASVRAERFKVTRNLDFFDSSSYDNAYRTDYHDANDDGIEGKDLITEMTDDTHAGFLPIGIGDAGKTHEFSGVFNGGSYSISGLRLNKSLQQNIGLFGYTTGATLKNLTFKNCVVVNHNQTAAALVGKAEGGLIENITVDSQSILSLDEDDPDRDTYAGGIVGYLTLNATVRGCTNRASVTTRFSGDTGTYSGPAGGIAGWMAHSTIENCENYGTITGQKYIGGIVGFGCMQNEGGTDGGGNIIKCNNYGEVTTYITANGTGPGNYVGGIAGYVKKGGTMTSCINKEEASVHGIGNVGGIIGGIYGTATDCHNYSKNITAVRSTVHGLFGMTDKGATTTGCIDHAGIN